MPALSALAPLFSATVTVVLAPGSRVPPVAVRLTQLGVPTKRALQPIAVPPVLLKVWASELGLNGPPIWPALVSPAVPVTERKPMLGVLTISETLRSVVVLLVTSPKRTVSV